MKVIKESLTPCEGYFWVINNNIVGTIKEVPKYGFIPEQSDTHKDTWNKFKPKGCDKSFDYYPRGRVMVDPEYNNDGIFDHYNTMIFIDPCLNTPDDKKLIIDFYNLGNTNIMWMNNLKMRAGIDHYSCYKCRK